MVTRRLALLGAGKGRLIAYRPGLDGAVALPLSLRHAVLGLAAGR